VRRAFTALLIVTAVIPGGRAFADYYHYGVAADEFLDDNDRFWSALSRYPEWS